MIYLIYLIFLTSCTVGPDYERPQIFENKEIEKSLELSPSHSGQENIPFSLSSFQDEVLNQLLEKGSKNSPSIRSALIKLAQGRHNLRIQDVASLPTLDISGEYYYLKDSKNTLIALNEDYYQLGLDVSWEIDIFGGNRRKTEIAQAQLKQSIENLKNIYTSLMAEIASVYFNLRATERLIENLTDTLQAQTDLVDLGKNQTESGLFSQIELNQLQSDLSLMQSKHPLLVAQKQLYQNSLALLVGELPQSLNSLLNKRKNIINTPFRYPIEKLYELPASVIRNRPDVRAQEEGLIAQNAAIGVAIADIYPKVSLSTFLGFQSKPFHKLLENKSYAYAINPQFDIPLFHFGALKENIELQKTLKESSLIAYEESLLNAAKEIRNAMVNFEQQLKQNDFYLKQFNHLFNIFQLNKKQYESGLIPLSTLIQTQQNLLSSQENLINSNNTLYQNIIQFYKAIGGDINSKLKKATPKK